MNKISGLWMHDFKVNPFQNLDAFHCICIDEDACKLCVHCGVAERYKIQGRIHQWYKFGYDICKDWDDVKEVYNENV